FASLIKVCVVASVCAALPLFSTTKFTNAVDIPVEFIEKNVKLRGKIHHVTEKGLEVEHIPITIPIVTSIQRKCLLLVRLAGVELAPSGMVWLQKELKPSQMVWFQLLGREDLALECRVLVNKGRFLSVCLNEEILRQGLGRTARIEGLHHDSRLYWKLHKRLLRAELKALKKNKGIWQEESFSERASSGREAGPGVTGTQSGALLPPGLSPFSGGKAAVRYHLVGFYKNF
uniref:Chromosome 3 open reading frame 33 n=1 Tax=Anas platyrhynchos platyrhynchos TaxID=8840 RepID=A0A493T3W9_ANAPP